MPSFLSAESLLIASRGPILSSAKPLINLISHGDQIGAIQPSLFVGKSGNSLFRPLALQSSHPFTLRATRKLDQLRDLIGQAESARAGYDAVQHGATILPRKLPTHMSLGEIYQWIDTTPDQPHAIGRYQFIPKTLRRLAQRLGVSSDERFTPALQDRLSDILLSEAGFFEFENGTLSRHGFMHNLSKIWAGLPTKTGKSYYHGLAGNAATITWPHFDAEMARIFG